MILVFNDRGKGVMRASDDLVARNRLVLKAKTVEEQNIFIMDDE